MWGKLIFPQRPFLPTSHQPASHVAPHKLSHKTLSLLITVEWAAGEQERQKEKRGRIYANLMMQCLKRNFSPTRRNQSGIKSPRPPLLTRGNVTFNWQSSTVIVVTASLSSCSLYHSFNWWAVDSFVRDKRIGEFTLLSPVPSVIVVAQEIDTRTWIIHSNFILTEWANWSGFIRHPPQITRSGVYFLIILMIPAISEM